MWFLLLKTFLEIVIKESIKGTLGDPFEGIEIQDLLHEALLIEESPFYSVFTKEEREELLIKVFGHLVCGGAMCQYEDKIGAYLDITRIFYKALVRY